MVLVSKHALLCSFTHCKMFISDFARLRAREDEGRSVALSPSQSGLKVSVPREAAPHSPAGRAGAGLRASGRLAAGSGCAAEAQARHFAAPVLGPTGKVGSVSVCGPSQAREDTAAPEE